MKRGYKARPHDIEEVMMLNPEIIELHASDTDLLKKIEGKYDVPVVVHLPEYEGKTLLDPASTNERDRLKAVKFFKDSLSVVREWGEHFKGSPKAIIHPGGWSVEPLKPWECDGLYNSLAQSISEFNLDGIDFLIENMPPAPWFYGGQWYSNILKNPTDCRNFCTGGIGFCFDICHAFLYCNDMGSITMQEFMSIVRPIIGHVHFSDARGVDGEGLQIGEGDMPLKDIFRYLNPLNVGAVSEIWQQHKDGLAGMIEAWKRTDVILEELKKE